VGILDMPFLNKQVADFFRRDYLVLKKEFDGFKQKLPRFIARFNLDQFAEDPNAWLMDLGSAPDKEIREYLKEMNELFNEIVFFIDSIKTLYSLGMNHDEIMEVLVFVLDFQIKFTAVDEPDNLSIPVTAKQNIAREFVDTFGSIICQANELLLRISRSEIHGNYEKYDIQLLEAVPAP
jgi:hypothetical protein